MDYRDYIDRELAPSQRILIASLNWGLGHATRCIPIIRYLLEKKKHVVIATDGEALHLLQKEFTGLAFETLPSYRIRYTWKSMGLNMVLQSFRIGRAIILEKKVIKKLAHHHQIDTIISDNRYGARHHNTRNIIISHQIHILHPWLWFRSIVSALHASYIRRFDKCWIPDLPPPDNLSGDMSKSNHLKNAYYIGHLSRMEFRKLTVKRKILVILSGPEPARSKLETKIKSVLLGQDYMLIRGTTSKGQCNPNNREVDMLTSCEINNEICSSELVICRSGYSSIMDLMKLGSNAILIPTPGQYEQEYLAERLSSLYPSRFKMIVEKNIQALPNLLK